MSEKCDHETCPVIEKVNELELSMKQLKEDAVLNEKALEKVSSDLKIHMLNSENRSVELSNGLKELHETFKKHMLDEEKSVIDLKDSIDKFKEDLFDPRDGLFTTLKSNVDEGKFKTKIMWGLIGSVGLSALGVIVHLIKGAIQ